MKIIAMLYWELIYLLLSWNTPVKIRKKIVSLMICSDNYDLNRLIQPIRLFKRSSKKCWESCAYILSEKNITEMSDSIIDKLFIWLQDMNWPGAEIIFSYLVSAAPEKWILNYERAVERAVNDNDNDWLYSLCKIFLLLDIPKEIFTDEKIFNYICNFEY